MKSCKREEKERMQNVHPGLDGYLNLDPPEWQPSVPCHSHYIFFNSSSWTKWSTFFLFWYLRYIFFLIPFFHPLSMASNSDLNRLTTDFELKLRAITKWLKDSGLKINKNKTELCLFHRNDHAPIQITVNGTTLTSKSSINI